MVLYVDKYRPTKLDKLTLHPHVTARLKKMVAAGNFPHLMFYGPSGGGKATRIAALLREIYGPGAEKIKVAYKSFQVAVGKSSKKTIEINTIASNHHIQVTPSDVGRNDTHVVQYVIKEIAQTHNVSASSRAFKVVVVNEADRLSKGAQDALRRTMEKYTSSCRLILCCESACGITGPLRSRVLALRIPLPTEPEIVGVLEHVSHKENLNLPKPLAERIAGQCNRNLRRAILQLEACRVDSRPLKPDQRVRIADWERFIDDLARSITEEQSPSRLLLARGKLYELLTNCIPPETVIKTLTMVLLRRLDDQLKHEVVFWAAHYEHRLQQGNKAIFHLEAFVAKFMAIYKRWVVESFG